MTWRARLADWLYIRMVAHVVLARGPDFIVGADHPDGPYLRRWYLTPWRGWYRDVPEADRSRWQRLAVRVSRLLPNLYLHRFLRDDDDRALHDHPAWAISFILRGGYCEHTIDAGGIHQRRRYLPGSLRFLRATHAHRIELLSDSAGAKVPCWTLFLFGPTSREWGFWCGERWVPWQEFTRTENPGEVGKGCN